MRVQNIVIVNSKIVNLLYNIKYSIQSRFILINFIKLFIFYLLNDKNRVFKISLYRNYIIVR